MTRIRIPLWKWDAYDRQPSYPTFSFSEVGKGELLEITFNSPVAIPVSLIIDVIEFVVRVRMAQTSLPLLFR